MNCPICGEALHLNVLDDKDNNLAAFQVICPKHGKLLLCAIIDGEPVILKSC